MDTTGWVHSIAIVDGHVCDFQTRQPLCPKLTARSGPGRVCPRNALIALDSSQHPERSPQVNGNRHTLQKPEHA
eukprot:6928418-Prymnesium_polylepis.1